MFVLNYRWFANGKQRWGISALSSSLPYQVKMIFLTVPTLEMAFLLDTFLFVSNLYLYCNVSSNSRRAKSRKMVCWMGQNSLLVGGWSAFRPCSAGDQVTLAPLRASAPSSTKWKHWVTDLAYLDSKEHLNGHQVLWTLTNYMQNWVCASRYICAFF